VTVALVAAAAIAIGIPQASSAAPGHGDAAAATQEKTVPAPGFPTFVHLPADQAAHPSAAVEWWYTVGHLRSYGHEYGYEVALTSSGRIDIAITDVTAGKYYSREFPFNANQISMSSATLDVRTPTATLSGPMNAMQLTGSVPEGSLDLHLDARGRVMYDNGTGLFPFLGSTSYYYSLPSLRTSGTLTLNGKTSTVTGESWLDRQWGSNWDWTQLTKWTWMAIQLSNGESINLWDMFTKRGEQQWATVLHRDGSESVVSVSPLAQDARDFVTSRVSGQRYAGTWTVVIPGLDTRLTVADSPLLQELNPYTPHNEAAATVGGVYQGGPMTGKAYVEQFGNWK
jgi:predicted secreted hydrolase